MPNIFTLVPEQPVPKLPTWMEPVLIVADLFMVAMLSRPPSGTLRTTWVTPATIGLCALVEIAGIPLGILGIIHGVATGSLVLSVGSVALLVFAAGSIAVLAVAIAQHAGKS